MKRPMQFLLCLLLVALLSSPVFASAASYPEKQWFTCQSDDDCVKTTGICWCWGYTDEAVNKNYLKQFNKKYPSANGPCMQGMLPPPPDLKCHYHAMMGPDVVAKCTGNICSIVVPDKKD